MVKALALHCLRWAAAHADWIQSPDSGNKHGWRMVLSWVWSLFLLSSAVAFCFLLQMWTSVTLTLAKGTVAASTLTVPTLVIVTAATARWSRRTGSSVKVSHSEWQQWTRPYKNHPDCALLSLRAPWDLVCQHHSIRKHSVLLNVGHNSHFLFYSPCFSCELADINECSMPNKCQNGKCVNTEGSYTCECNSGFAKSWRGLCEGDMHAQVSVHTRSGYIMASSCPDLFVCFHD